MPHAVEMNIKSYPLIIYRQQFNKTASSVQSIFIWSF